MRRPLLVLALTVILGGGFVRIALSSGGLTPVDPPPAPEAGGSHSVAMQPYPVDPEPVLDKADSLVLLPCTSPQQDLNFANFWAGTGFDGLKVSAVIRRCDLPLDDEPVRANYVSYLYGDCVATDGIGCAPPIEVQTWPGQERNKQTLATGPVELRLVGADTTVEGVPATRYEDGDRLEIYFSDVTVVIFGDDPSRIDRFAAALKEGPVVLAERPGANRPDHERPRRVGDGGSSPVGARPTRFSPARLRGTTHSVATPVDPSRTSSTRSARSSCCTTLGPPTT